MLGNVAGKARERQGSGRRKMLVRIIAFSLCLTFLICIWIKVTDYRDFRRDLTTYQGVKLGDSMEEIKYALGYPPFVLGPETHDEEFDGYFQYVYQTDGKDLKNAMPDGKKVEDFLYWTYEQVDRRIDLTFDPNTKRVSEIGCYVNSTAAGGKSGYCTALFGIDSNSTEANVLAALGAPDAEKFSGPSKSLRYKSLGLEITLSKRRVYMLRKTDLDGSSFRWFLSRRLL